MKKIFSLLITTVIISLSANSQDVLNDNIVEDRNSIYKKVKHQNKIVQEYTPLRQADVMWSRKIWREIDLRQKINHGFYYPKNNGEAGAATTSDRKSLIDVIYSAIQEGSIVAYGDAVYDDEFRSPMTASEIKTIGGAKEETIQIVDMDLLDQGYDQDDAMKDTTFIKAFDRNTVKKWRLKEEWFFDKQRSVMDVRIIGMAPLQEARSEVFPFEITGEWKPLFWVHFREARKILINAEVFNLVKNDAERRTYDDIFWKRMFGSVIVKEANVMDRKVSQYMVGLDALLEAERIKAEIFNMEHDLWEY
jgi:gliding motility associated protien GldN